MFKSLFGAAPKKKNSLESLSYMQQILHANMVVKEENKAVIVESLRSVAEIVIWGDQNDPLVFEYFLEKDMITYFDKILTQKGATSITVQVLQTLNILFENLSSEMAIYYLLSNNHMNRIIQHDYEFADEEILAYYISFLKILSLRLNSHTIHFFFNEHLHNFPLYSSAVRFYNNKESMVRIAVRTLTLNVYRVGNPAVIDFVCQRPSSLYFANLVWLIGNQSVELDLVLRSPLDSELRSRIDELVDLHIDVIQYIQDILHLEIEKLSKTVCKHLVDSLFIPLYVYCLSDEPPPGMDKNRIGPTVSLFFLAHVFMNFSFAPVINSVASTIVYGHPDFLAAQASRRQSGSFTPTASTSDLVNAVLSPLPAESPLYGSDASPQSPPKRLKGYGECFLRAVTEYISRDLDNPESGDMRSLPAMCLIYSFSQNSCIQKGILASSGFVSLPGEGYNQGLIDKLLVVLETGVNVDAKIRLVTMQVALMLIKNHVPCEVVPISRKQSFIELSARPDVSADTSQDGSERSSLQQQAEEDEASASHLADFNESVDGVSLPQLAPEHLHRVKLLLAAATVKLEAFFNIEEQSIESADKFLGMLEDEHRWIKPLKVAHLIMGKAILLAPADLTPDMDLSQRLPRNATERLRKVFLLLRQFYFYCTGEKDNLFPLVPYARKLNVRDSIRIDTDGLHILSCNVIARPKPGAPPIQVKRYLIVDDGRLMLAEMDSQNFNKAQIRLIADVNVVVAEEDSIDGSFLNVTVQALPSANARVIPAPVFNGKLLFADHAVASKARQFVMESKAILRSRKLDRIREVFVIDQQPQTPGNVTIDIDYSSEC